MRIFRIVCLAKNGDVKGTRSKIGTLSESAHQLVNSKLFDVFLPRVFFVARLLQIAPNLEVAGRPAHERDVLEPQPVDELLHVGAVGHIVVAMDRLCREALAARVDDDTYGRALVIGRADGGRALRRPSCSAYARC